MKVLLQLPLSKYVGYGNDGIGIAQALTKAGVDVYLNPTHVDAPLPKDITDLLQKTLTAPFDLTIVHLDPSQLIISEAAREATGLAVAWTMWESTSMSRMRGYSKLRGNLKYFDALLNYDQVGLDALAPHVPRKVKTGILQGGFWPQDWPYVERDWHHPEQGFWFSMVGQLHRRKDPFAALQAFNELQDEYPEEMADVHLALKTSVPGLHPAIETACKNVKIYYESWTIETLKAFYASTHCLLAPSRGEGKNMPALEMQSTGGVAIATDWGGHKGWLNPDYSYPIDYDLILSDPVRAPGNLEAAVRKESLKAQMLRVVRNRGEAEHKGRLASETLRRTHDWENVMDGFFQKLEELSLEKGTFLNAEYKLLRTNGELSE